VFECGVPTAPPPLPVTAHPAGACVALAALFERWRHADGALGAAAFPRVAREELPSGEQLGSAAGAVRAQADAVRALKQREGLSNQVRLRG
jgi:hypothetical protein